MTQTEPAPIGIVCPMAEEVVLLTEALEAAQEAQSLAGLSFRSGTLSGRRVVLVEGGIGKVNTGMVTTLLADRFGCAGLILSGVAGGLDPLLKVGDLVIGTRLVQHDYGALIAERIKTYQPGTPPLPGFEAAVGYAVDSALIDRVRRALDGLALPPLPAGLPDAGRVPALHFGPILSGDSFVNCETTRGRLHAEFDGMAVEMEGGAMAQIAARWGLPVINIRALSDLAGADSHIDFEAFLPQAAESAARVVMRVLPVL